MIKRLDQLVERAAQCWPDKVALWQGNTSWTYRELALQVERVAASLQPQLQRDDRVALYGPKSLLWVAAYFAVSRVGAVAIPVNPQLKAAQVWDILDDSQAALLLTPSSRAEDLARLRPLNLPWYALEQADWLQQTAQVQPVGRIDADMAAILYTSGSTGKPKGVVLSQRNLLVGVDSVVEYLQLSSDDHLLALLPFSFDYGLNQLLSSVAVGACLTLMDYLLPNDVIRTLIRQQITGLAAVPPLWSQLARLDWPPEAVASLRYMTNSGGALPESLVQLLRTKAPAARLFLMYGLTEAFRSTYLEPEQLDQRPNSIGKAIPNAEILVLNADGLPCAPGEVGELVHRGALVAQGYWRAPELTAQRFKTLVRPHGLSTELAVFSGDQVYQDEAGYLYFVGRTDEQIKTSGYRVSPTEIEAVAYQVAGVNEAVAFGIADDQLGQAIVLLWAGSAQVAELQAHLKTELPAFQWPRYWLQLPVLARNPNNKFDRTLLKQQFLADLAEAKL